MAGLRTSLDSTSWGTSPLGVSSFYLLLRPPRAELPPPRWEAVLVEGGVLPHSKTLASKKPQLIHSWPVWLQTTQWPESW
jgi:hypothetical protein